MLVMGLPLRARAPLFSTLSHSLRRAARRQTVSADPLLNPDGLKLLHPTVALAQPTRERHSRVISATAASRPGQSLRVLCQPQRGGGRLALAGRMADVCAELDRLALQ